ncbi:hypothetical protein [Prosthecobacter sp.]|uniref:hypothetical protein n=1 Tax=Prosthecobacter sp. TaxID=1965333 RepID=UPI001D30C496|nr:hypothetical protein [Prosthecobacter sp.]MCB1278576.1 hypothetical protein [Prosthecobacter sp.]
MADLPDQHARQNIDALLAAAGWAVRDYKVFDPSAALGVALREVLLKSGRYDDTPFNQKGVPGKAHQLFGGPLPKLLEELNEALAA